MTKSLNNTGPSSHSKIGASSAHRWMHCPASAHFPASQFQATFANTEGTVAHAIAEKVLDSWKTDQVVTVESFLGSTYEESGFSHTVTDEMVDAVSTYVNHIYGTVRKGLVSSTGLFLVSEYKNIEVECKFSLNWLYSDMYGTCDACWMDAGNRVLHVFDLKYGKSTPVYAERNVQLMYYALGIAPKRYHLLDNGDEVPDPCGTVVLHIVQPRCESGITTWEISYKDLLKFAYDELIPAARRVKSSPRLSIPGDWCKWCAGLGKCTGVYKELEPMIDLVQTDTTGQESVVSLPPVQSLTREQRLQLLAMRPILKDYLDSIYEQSLADALDGHVIPGFKLVSSRPGNRTWSVSEKLVVASLGGSDDDLYKPRVLKSPAELEKVYGKGVIKPLCSRGKSGAMILVPEQDKRKAIYREDSMARAFEKMGSPEFNS